MSNVVLKAAPPERQEKNKKFANDGSYESVRLQLNKLAMKCFSRAQAMGVNSLTFDDVLQEMNLSYTRARDKWNPQAGTLFVTYMTTACYQNFNERFRKLENERAHLGMVSFSDMQSASDDHDDDGLDPLERHDISDSKGFYAPSMSGNGMDDYVHRLHGAGELSESPERAVEARQQMQESVRVNLSKLTPKAQQFVIAMMRAAHTGGDIPKLSEIAKVSGTSETELKRIRMELRSLTGVRV